MKVIDLLNKMANGERLPNKIKLDNKIWTCKEDKKYYNQCEIELIDWYGNELQRCLNDYLELIEDETIDIDNIEEIDIDQVINTDDKTGIALLHINKLIRAVKQLNKEIKELNKKYCCNCGVELTEENTALPNMCNECKYGEEWEQC